jgi:ABC-type Fe3+/spermidine/putrescine transport system ATPase subunit
MIAGLEEVQSGDILWNGESMLQVPVHHRNFGLMFQDYALFPHRNVWDNVVFGLQMQGASQAIRQEMVRQSLEKVQMLDFAEREVTDLSGGEQQRVALARTLAAGPRLLLLDEPLAALDRSLRKQLLTELRKILRETGIPAIYVTHDQEEAYTIADTLALLMNGRIVQMGSPADVYQNPVSLQAAAFLGLSNQLTGTITGSSLPIQVQTGQGVFLVERSAPGQSYRQGEPVVLVLREANLFSRINESNANVLRGKVTDSLFREVGFHTTVSIDDGAEYQFILDQSRAVGDQVQLEIPSDKINLFHLEPNE